MSLAGRLLAALGDALAASGFGAPAGAPGPRQNPPPILVTPAPPARPIPLAPPPPCPAVVLAPEADAKLFAEALRLVLGLEGDAQISLDPADPGNFTGPNFSGELRGTKYGISARAYPSLNIAGLTLASASSIYRVDYWQRAACAQLAAIGAPGLAIAMFDCAVNQGSGAAAKLLQLAAGAAVDGAFGPASLAAVRRHANDYPALALEFQARRMLHYTSLSTFSRFGLGWTRRAFTIARAALAAA